MTAAGRRLLEVAAERFYADGINTVGVAAIAEAAEVTKKTLYDCFGSKSGLVVAYLEDRHAKWWSYLEQCLAEAESPRVLALHRAYLHHPGLDASRGCGFINGVAELPADHPGRAVIRRHKDAVRRKISELVTEDRPDLEAPDVLAEHLFLVLEGAVAQSGVEGDVHRLRYAGSIAEALLTPARAAP